MGWSLGTNDAANAFGTAVSTRVVKYRTAIIIIAFMVLLGAALLGYQNVDKLSNIAVNNKVSADITDVEQAIANGTLAELRLKSALKAFIIFACAAITVFVIIFLLIGKTVPNREVNKSVYFNFDLFLLRQVL